MSHLVLSQLYRFGSSLLLKYLVCRDGGELREIKKATSVFDVCTFFLSNFSQNRYMCPTINFHVFFSQICKFCWQPVMFCSMFFIVFGPRTLASSFSCSSFGSVFSWGIFFQLWMYFVFFLNYIFDCSYCVLVIHNIKS